VLLTATDLSETSRINQLFQFIHAMLNFGMDLAMLETWACRQQQLARTQNTDDCGQAGDPDNG
jgi:hypothetical protein